MSQNWTDNPFDSGHDWDVDMQGIEDNFLCLKAMFSGATAPSNPIAGMPWFDTTKKLLKHRNNANAAWRGILAGSASFKMLVYLDAAEDGWAIDSTITDKVVALKGGSVYATGGATAGNWALSGVTIPDHAHAEHVHQWYKHYASVSQHDKTFDSNGNEQNAGPGSGDAKSNGYRILDRDSGFTFKTLSSPASATFASLFTSAVAISGGGGGNVVSDAAWRPAAAVCTLQYPDV